MNIIPVEYLAYEKEEWISISPEEIAARNDPDAFIIPVYEDGKRGEQTTWGEWEKRLSLAIKVSSRAKTIAPKQTSSQQFFQEEKNVVPDSTIMFPSQIKIIQPSSALESKEFKELVVVAKNYIKLLYNLTIISFFLLVLGFVLSLFS